MAVFQTTLAEIVPDFPVYEATPQMQVRKRNGSWEPVDVNKIVRAVQRCCHGLSQVDPMRVASRTVGGLYDGATTRELDSISIQTAASLIAEEPEYSKLAARLLLATITKEVSGQNIYSFSRPLMLDNAKASLQRILRNLCFRTRENSMMRSMMSFPIASNTSACAPSMTDICCAILSRGR